MDDTSLAKHLDDSKKRMAAFTAKVKIQQEIEAVTEKHLASMRLLLDEQNGALSELHELSASCMEKRNDGMLGRAVPLSRLKDAVQAINDSVEIYGSAIDKLTASLEKNGVEPEQANTATNTDQSDDADVQPEGNSCRSSQP